MGWWRGKWRGVNGGGAGEARGGDKEGEKEEEGVVSIRWVRCDAAAAVAAVAAPG